MVALVSRKELMRRVELEGVGRTVQHLRGALRKGHLKPNNFRIKDLAEALIVSRDGKPVGREWTDRLAPSKRGGVMLAEAAIGVSSTGFSNITGQILYTRLMESYQDEAFIGSQLVEEYQTDFNGEKIPGISGIVEDVQEVKENMPFPEVGFGDDYIETPRTTKRGFILSITKETIFFDRTNLVLQQAGTIGTVLARKKEKLILDMVLGFTNNFKWRGTTYNTFQAATPWINTLSGQDLANLDWTYLDLAEQLFTDMLEPNTNEPIEVTPTTILAMPAKLHHFRQTLGAVEIETETDSNNRVRRGPNTLTQYNVLSSRLAYRRMLANGVSAANAKNTWFFGDPKKAFAWQYNWPITVVQAPNNHEAEFKQDIQFRWKASERGSAVVKNPRYWAKIYNV